MDVIRKIGATQTDSSDRPVNPIVIDGEFRPAVVCTKSDLINSNILSLSLIADCGVLPVEEPFSVTKEDA